MRRSILEAEVGAWSADVYPRAEEEFTPARELYGLALARLPRALVLALNEPLLLLPPPPRLPVLLPSRIPTWWALRIARRFRSRRAAPEGG